MYCRDRGATTGYKWAILQLCLHDWAEFIGDGSEFDPSAVE